MRPRFLVLVGLVLTFPAGRLPAQQLDEAKIRAAVERALPPVQRGLVEFQARWVPPRGFPLPDHLKKVGCISCHHEGVGLSTLSFLRDRGFAIDESLARKEAEKLHTAFQGFAPLYRRALTDPKSAQEADFFGDIAVELGYMLGGLLDAGQAPDESTDAAARILLKHQEEDGSWTSAFDREPMQMSDFTTTALAARLIRAYGPGGVAEKSVGRARSWLEANRGPNTDDLAFRLLGLAWTGASDAVRAEAASALRSVQHEDGGWAQLPSTKASDAYATGLALMALNRGGGVSASDPGYRRGLAFLISTQKPDGTWFVRKWSHAYNQYFDAGFPYGKNQFISLPATCYAMMALAEASGPPKPLANRRTIASPRR